MFSMRIINTRIQLTDCMCNETGILCNPLAEVIWKRTLRIVHPIRWWEVFPKNGPAKKVSFAKMCELSKVGAEVS